MRGGFGGYQAIRIDVDLGILIGGSDPRIEFTPRNRSRVAAHQG